MSQNKDISSKIVSWEALKELCLGWKSKNQKIVFTNGCFDILHYGHVYYLSQAAKHGDKLIIAINSDQSVKILKGNNRPINKEHQRAYVLSALEFVDAVTAFNQETPKDIIDYLIPDVLIKGGDYELNQIVGAETVIKNGGKVDTIKFVEGFSTTNLLKNM